jgi:hypothetical protein
MGRIDIFPGDDIGARNNLARWMHTCAGRSIMAESCALSTNGCRTEG